MLRFFRLLLRPLEFGGRGGYFEISRLAWPLIIMGASNTIMQFVDRKFLSSLSTTAVAAALPAGILYFTLFCIFFFTAGFTSAIVAQYHGAKDKESVLSTVWSGAYFSVAAALIIVFALPSLGEWLIKLGGHSPELITFELEYYHALIPSGAFGCASVPFFSFFSGRGKTLPVAIINILGCLLNIPLDYAFIFGWGSLPALGIMGAGLATSICAMFTMITVIVYFLLHDQRDYPTRSQRKPVWSCVVRLVRYGVPSGVQIAFDVGAFTLVTFAVGHLGSLALAAHVITLSINNMFFIPLLGLSEATAILSGQYIGRAKHGIARRVAHRSWRIAALYMTLGGIVYLVFPVMLAEMFGPEQNREEFQSVIITVRWLLAVAFLFNFCDTLKFIYTAALRGAGDTRVVLIICMCCSYGLMVPGTFLLIWWFKTSVIMIWLWLAFVALIEGSFLLLRFRAGKWRFIRMIKPPTRIAKLDERR